jgi:hypothetical protein
VENAINKVVQAKPSEPLKHMVRIEYFNNFDSMCISVGFDAAHL